MQPKNVERGLFFQPFAALWNHVEDRLVYFIQWVSERRRKLQTARHLSFYSSGGRYSGRNHAAGVLGMLAMVTMEP